MIEVQAPANFDRPPIIELDLPVMHVGIEPDIQDNIELKEALLQFSQLFLYIGELGLIVMPVISVIFLSVGDFTTVSQKRTKF